MVERLEEILSFATMFEDTDTVEDRNRILRKADEVITTFLKLLNDYYRVELQLRFKCGVRHDSQHKEKYDALILKGLQLIGTFRTVIVEEIHDPEAQTEEVSRSHPQVKRV